MLPYWRLSAYYFFYFAFIGAFSPYFGLYLESLRFPAFDIGVLMSLMQVMRVVAPNVWGWLAERAGSRMPIVRLAGAASALAFLGLFGTTSFVGVFLALAALAFFWGAALPLVETVTLSHLQGDSGRYGRIRVWGSIGFIAAVLGCGYLLDVAPPAALLWVALAILGGIFVAALLVPEGGSVRHAADALRLSAILRRREVAGLLAACFFMSAAHGALYVFYSIFLVDHGYSKALVGWLWTLGVVAEILVFLWMPRLQAALGLRAILLASFACAVLRFLLIGWGVASLAVLVFAQLLHGATFGAYHAAAVAAINRWFPGRHQARGQALYSSLSFGAGGMLGAVASGYAWERIGASLTYSLGSAFALVGLALMVLAWPARSPALAAPR